MSCAVFCDPAGIIIQVVKTDGPNAAGDLAIHTKIAEQAGYSIVLIDDDAYAGFKDPKELLAHVISLVPNAKMPPLNPAPVSNVESAEKAAARKIAVELAVSQGKTPLEIMTAAQAAADSVVAVVP